MARGLYLCLLNTFCNIQVFGISEEGGRSAEWAPLMSLLSAFASVAVYYSGNFQCQWQFLIAALHLQSSGAVPTGRQAWTLIPYPILPPSLISHTVSVDIKHRERSEEIQPSELRGCVNREVGLD